MTLLLCLYSLGMSTLVVFQDVNTIERSDEVDAQRMGEAVIRAKAKLGTLLKAIPKTESARSSRKGKSSRVLPKGITYKTSHQAQTIATNPEQAQAVIDTGHNYKNVATPSLPGQFMKRLMR